MVGWCGVVWASGAVVLVLVLVLRVGGLRVCWVECKRGVNCKVRALQGVA